MASENKTEEDNSTSSSNDEQLLKELQKDFPNSKESSISFPNIDKVNKKLSDLFNYIEKNTMEESEETKELEKQRTEAEIELTKAQTIRETKRKFGASQNNIVKIKYLDFNEAANEYIKHKNEDKNLEEIKKTINNINDLLSKAPSNDLLKAINEKELSIEELEKKIKKNSKDLKSLNGQQLNNSDVIFDQTNIERFKILSNQIINGIEKTSDIDKEILKITLEQIKENPPNFFNSQDVLEQKHITYILHTIYRFKVRNYDEKFVDNFISQRLNCLFYVLCNLNDNYVNNIKISIKIIDNKLIEKISNEILKNFCDNKNFNIKTTIGELESNQSDFTNFFKQIMNYDIKILEFDLKNVIISKFKKVVSKISSNLKYENNQKTSEINNIKQEIKVLNEYKTTINSTINVLQTIVEELNNIKNNIGSIAVRKFRDTLENYGLLSSKLKKIMHDYIVTLKDQEEGITEKVNLPEIEKELFPMIDNETLINKIEENYTVKVQQNDKNKGNQINKLIKKEINDLRKLTLINTQFFSMFNTHNEKAFKYYLSYFPVKNIINLSTFVSGGENSEEQKQANNTLKIIKAELGKIMESIQIQQIKKKYGPFYKILHTGHIEDEQGEKKKINKKYHDITEEFNNLISNNDIEHIIYAGYGFSGSGKTYTLLEKSNDNSILKQIERLLKENDIKPKIETYSRYAEIYDSNCNNAIDDYYPEKENLIKINEIFQDYEKWKIEQENQKDISISDYIENINEKRKQKTIGAEKNLYRTSIRATSFNKESSRSHLFVDIKFTNKQNQQKVITLLDMAGNENVNVLQEQYFTKSNGYIKNKSINLENTIKKIIEFVIGLKDPQKNAEADPTKSGLSQIDNLLQEKDEYNIKKKSWEELFISINNQSEKDEQDEQDYFLDNYNKYQIYEQIENLLEINKGLKLLEENKFKSLTVARNNNKNLSDLQVLQKYEPYEQSNENIKEDELFNYEESNNFKWKPVIKNAGVLKNKRSSNSNNDANQEEFLELQKIKSGLKLNFDNSNSIKTCLMSTIDKGISENCFKDLFSIFSKENNVVKNFNKIENILTYFDFLIFKIPGTNEARGKEKPPTKIYTNIIKESEKIYDEEIRGKYSFSSRGKETENDPEYLNTSLDITINKFMEKSNNLSKPTDALIYPDYIIRMLKNGKIATVFKIYRETILKLYTVLLQYLYKIFDNILNLDTEIEEDTQTINEETYLHKIFTKYKKDKIKKNKKDKKKIIKNIEPLLIDDKSKLKKIEKFINEYRLIDDNKLKKFIEEKKKWDNIFIGKYHCPLRFQGNAINASIEELKKNLQAINTTKKNTYTSDTFPFDVWKVQHSEKYRKKNYVIFTNVRLDFNVENNDDAKYKAFDNSLTFSEQLIKPKSIKFGKKISKKTSTRSFRKRGRHRGPSETEIL